MLPPFRIAVITTTGMWSVDAFACTLCHSPQAVSVRARLLQSDLWSNLFMVVLPIALLGWIIAMVAHGPAGGAGVE